MTAKSNHDHCFEPIARRDATTLIVGSLPGQRSLAEQRYYAHPHNAFWKLIAEIFHLDPSLPYERKVSALTKHRIALWDVCAAAERPGSLDSSIVHETLKPNDFERFFRAHRRIRRVFFNGRKAEGIYRRFVLPTLSGEHAHLEYACLPSTSPAHAGMRFAEKLEQWKAIKETKS